MKLYLLKLLSKPLLKYAYVIGLILIFTGWYITGGVILGFIILAFIFRRETRSIVYNYVLVNGVYLKRLEEVNITEESGQYIFDSEAGTYLLKKRKVYKWQFYIAVCFWGFVNDNPEYDTVPTGYGLDIINKLHFAYMPDWFRKYVAKEQSRLDNELEGRAFQLADSRTKVYLPLLSTLWYLRNSAYNFNYLFEEIREDDPNNFYKVITIFGYKTHWGYIPYTNSVRPGRLVWWREDIQYIDEE
jgi:hypothetical protein